MKACIRTNMKKQYVSIKFFSLLVTMLIVFVILPVFVFAADEFTGKTIDLNSGASRDADFIAVDSKFTTKSGKSREVFMTGLKSGNKNKVLECLAEYFDLVESGTPVKMIDNAFADAEKWEAGIVEDFSGNTSDSSQYEGDGTQCWAASASNMLWISGWIKYLDDGTPTFKSEDDIFRLYTEVFTNEGSDTDRAIDWFFTGEYFLTGFKSHANFRKNDTKDRSKDGFKKSFVSSLAQKQHNIIEDAGGIKILVKAGPASGGSGKGQSVFQGSIGPLSDNELDNNPLHSVTIAGIITNPNAEKPGSKYKAIIIIDSDNDACPDQDEQQQVKAGTASRSKIKAARPNSCTVYPLVYMSDKNGIPGWEIVGYAAKGERWVLCDIDELFMPSASLIKDCSETEGSMDSIKHADLTLDTMFLTTSETGFTDPYYMVFDEDKVTKFEYGAPVRLSFFVANRARKDVTVYEDGKPLKLNWKVTSDQDGSVITQGSQVCELPLISRQEGGTDKPNLVTLNDKSGTIEAWKPGKYTLTAVINKDRAVREAYYKNNLEKKLHFTISDKDESSFESLEPESKESSESESDETPTFIKAANPMKVRGKTVTIRYRKLKKKSRIVKAAKAYKFSNKGKGTRIYKKVSVNRKKYAKKFKVNRKTGKITVKKGIKKGTYKVKIKITAAGNDTYQESSKTVTVRIRVK